MKNYMESIALPMAKMFSFMIRSGIFPGDLNIAKVIPLYQSGMRRIQFDYQLQAHLIIICIHQRV